MTCVAILSKASFRKPARVKSATAAKLRLLQSADLKRVPWLVHGFTTRPGGFTTSYGGRTLNVGFTKDDLRASVERNRKQVLLAAGAATKGKPWPLITLRQIHSDIIHVVRSRKPARMAGDGLVTDLRGWRWAFLPPTASLSCWWIQRRKPWARFMPGGAGR